MLIRGYNLAALYPPPRLEKVPRSVSSRHWRCEPADFVEPRDQKSLYVPEVLGGYFVFTLSTGDMVYTTGTRTQRVPPKGPLSWSTIGD